jgi:hypothetical protein
MIQHTSFLLIVTLLLAFTAGCISQEKPSPPLNIPVTTSFAGSVLQTTNDSSDPALGHIIRTSGTIRFNATLHNNFSTLPVYRGVLGENGSIDLKVKSIGDIRHNLIREEDAPDVARRILEPYGGIPPGAELNGASTDYSTTYNLTLNKVISKEPMFTSISYSQKKINGLWINGDSNRILLTLGDNGEHLWLSKIWRNYTYAGNVPVIPLDAAMEKLDLYEFLDSDWHPEAGEITIDHISQEYYARKLPNNDTLLEPVWRFEGGNAITDARLGFNVYARQFADFTATPTTAGINEEITFRDISDASPTKWSWNFGDGARSTLQKPKHAYNKPGNYTVILTVWNDLGSDMLTKKDYIIIG